VQRLAHLGDLLDVEFGDATCEQTLGEIRIETAAACERLDLSGTEDRVGEQLVERPRDGGGRG
jgi:hypothetical protein